MYGLIQPLLFSMDAERAHNLTFSIAGGPLGALAPSFKADTYPQLRTEAFGLSFPNPLGLAAGLDKNALLLPFWKKLGFGFVEVGTVTPKPQAGNPKPRLFRLKKDRALINRMGFNNAGLAAMQQQLEKRPTGLIVGANIGKNKVTPNEEAVGDYTTCFQGLQDLADYFVVNVSSPNTPGLRALQGKEALYAILSALQDLNQHQKPILLKLAPDLQAEQIADAAAVVKETQLAGIVATNTTLSRAHLKSDKALQEQAGGLSGAPLTTRAQEVATQLQELEVPFIGVGGIMNGADAKARLAAGASLVQVYSGFIYKGPGMVREILRELAK